MVAPPELVIVTGVELVQPFVSVAVTVYGPAARPLAVAAAPPEGDQLYVIVPVPPLPSAVALPLLLPQVAGVEPEIATVRGEAGWVIVIVVEPGQPLLSITLSVYVPAGSVEKACEPATLLKVATVVAPFINT